jgi:cytochrome c-type biogenesis protein CcmF
MGEKITVGAPFFNKVNIPIGLFLLLLTGVGPLIAWRRSSWESLKRAFYWPAIMFAVAVAISLAMGSRHFYASISFGLCAFVTATIVMEFYKGSRAIAGKSEMNMLRAAIELTHRNTRRYGGYLVHMGIVIMFIGFSGSAFNKDTTREVTIGDRFTMGGYEFHVDKISDGDNPNYTWQRAEVGVYKNGALLQVLTPERRVYLVTEQPTSEVSIRRRLNEDVYLNFAGISTTEDNKAIIQAYIFPLVSWIWVGFGVLMFGTMVCLIPSKARLSYPRTEVVGIYAEQKTVAK